MTKIDIISGFLGAGKTTLIKKLLNEAYKGEKLVLIENEFGEIGIDGGFLKDAGVEITEMNSGCICCSLVGDFGTALKQVLADYAPDRIIIEPSGVGKLSDVIAAVERVQNEVELELNSFVTVVDATKAKIYMKNFGEFFNNQVEHASAIILSRTQSCDEKKLGGAVKLLREKNAKAAILTTPWDQLTGEQIIAAMAGGHSLAEELMHEVEHHHHHHHDEHCDCGCHDHDHHHEHEHEHEHHHHDEHCDCGCHDHDHDHHHEHEHHHEEERCEVNHDIHEYDEAICTACIHASACSIFRAHTQPAHEHHHDHGEGCSCGCHDHDHNHHADEVFTSWGRETPRKYEREELQEALSALAMGEQYGMVLRAKGMVPCEDGKWLHFDLVPGEFEIREGAADYTGRLCVIGAELDEHGLEHLFGLH